MLGYRNFYIIWDFGNTTKRFHRDREGKYHDIFENTDIFDIYRMYINILICFGYLSRVGGILYNDNLHTVIAAGSRAFCPLANNRRPCSRIFLRIRNIVPDSKKTVCTNVPLLLLIH